MLDKLALVVLAGLFVGAPTSATAQNPDGPWLQYASPEEAGFSSEKLAEAREIAESNLSGAVMLIHRGRVVLAWGDVERRFRSHSVRKSFMSALIGIHAESGAIDMDMTLGELGIDDVDPLTDTEKTARVRDLIRARSGVYHTAAKEPLDMKAERPARGSHAPDTHWWYNNWDFNTLGTIFEMQTGTKIFEEFKAKIADPIGMEDFRLRDGVYELEPGNSRFPAYAYRMSARDYARFGQLFLQEGSWNDEQIIPAAWVAESTSAHSDIGRGRGYGYMWWVYPAGSFGDAANLAQSNRYDKYSATGTGGQFILVIPEADVVFVHRGDTDNDRRVSGGPVWNMVDIFLAARTGEPAADPELVPLAAVPFANALPGPTERTSIEIEPAVWRPYLGRYEVTPEIWFQMFEYEQRFFGRVSTGEEAEFLAESATKFFDISGSVFIEFIKDESGSVTQLFATIDGDRIPARKFGG